MPFDPWIRDPVPFDPWIRDPVPFDPWIRHPGWEKNSGSGSGMNIPDHISESLETIFTILKLFDVDPGSGKIRIRDPGINIPDPQYWIPLKFNVWVWNLICFVCCAARPTKRSLSGSRSRFGTASPGACPVPRLPCSGSSSYGRAESPIYSSCSNPGPHETVKDLRFQASTVNLSLLYVQTEEEDIGIDVIYFNCLPLIHLLYVNI